MAAEQGRGSPPGKLTGADRARIDANARAILTRELSLTFEQEDRRGWAHALCPLHSEETPSFGVSRDGAIRCQGCGFSGDAIAVLEKALGCTPGEAIRLALGSETEPPTRRRPGPPPSPDATTRNNGALVSPIPDDAPALPLQDREAARYAYRDEAGRVLLYVVRIEPGRNGRPGSKDCIPWTLRRRPDGKTNWRPTSQGVTPRPLYGRETLAPDRVVLFVEGEKAADAARKLWGDLAVVTTIGGAGQENQQHELEALAGRVVVFWPDHDEAGDKYAHALARRVLNAGAERVAIVDVPNELPEKWDLADLGPNFTAEQARGLIEAALDQDAAVQIREKYDAAGRQWDEHFEGFENDGEVAQLPDFPLDTLPPILRETAEAVAASPLADPAMAATACLVAVGNAAALKCALRVGPMKPVYSNIGAVLVGDVAEGKTTAVSRAEAATLAAMREADVDRSADVRRYRRNLEALEDAEKDARAKWKPNRNDDTERALDEAEKAVGECRRSPILPLTYVVGDVTPAQVAVTMRDNQGRTFVCSSEASFFGNLAGRFRSGEKSGISEIESTLQGLTNETVRITRKTSDPVVVERTALSVLVGMHAHTLDAIRADPQFIERGMFSRFLACFAKPHAHLRRSKDLYETPDVNATFRLFDELVRTLTVAPLPPDDPLFPPLVQMTKEARTAWDGFYDETHQQFAPAGRTAPIKGWASRSLETVQRIALTIHCAKNPAAFLQRSLSESTMNAAIRMVRDYFEPHAWVFHYGGPAGVAVTEAEYVAGRWYKRAVDLGRTVLSVGEITEACERYRRRRYEINPVLDELVRRRIAHEIPSEAGGPGRPTRRFELHPGFRPTQTYPKG